MIELKKCPICDRADFENLDYLRDIDYWKGSNPQGLEYIVEGDTTGFKVCKECGFLTYNYESDKELERRYDMIRTQININNIITSNRKLEYHRAFLEDIVSINVLDYGCSIGILLKDLEKNTLASKVYGVELNDISRKTAKEFYDLNNIYKTIDEIDKKVKFGLISLYHTFEHLQNPDKILKDLVSRLDDNGYIYITVPEYLNTLEEASGTITNDFENLYHLNHVNCFTKLSLKNILSKCGLEIVKENDIMYGYAILAKKTDKPAEIVKEDYMEVKATLEKQREAIALFNSNKKKEAVELYPKYPDAYISQSMQMENYKVFKKNIEILKKGLEECPNNARLVNQLASVYFQWDGSKKNYLPYSDNIKKAEELYKWLVENKPGSEDSYYFLAIIELEYKKDRKKAFEYLDKLLEINPYKKAEIENIKLNAIVRIDTEEK